ncbi:MAG: hypothetical protein HFH86_03490 [Bacilli bacterium]|jgi:hypothetical protein|nr:hypothetical protein [Bacilli bacterium]
MKSRSEKYYDENSNYIPTRTNRNSNLYKEINNSDLSNFNIASNAKVIGENESNYVNVEKIKEILEKNYHDVPKRREVKLSSKKPEIPLEIEQTKEYDINAILEKAREEKEVDYEKERLKKVRDTQYDILKNLNVEEEHTTEIKAADSKTKEELLELINTITENELQKTKLDPLDILTDLKGEDSNTVVMGVKDDTVALLNQEISKLDEEKKIEKDNAIDNSFYTNSLSFTQSDFDDFNDLKEDVESNKMVLKIIIIIMTLVIIIGIIIFLNKFLNLGLF